MTAHRFIASFFNRLPFHAIRHPWMALAAAAMATLAAAPGVLRLKLRTDGQALVSPEAPEVQYDDFIRGQFGIEDKIVVLIHSARPDGIFNPDTLQLVRDLTAELRKLPGVNPTNIVSLATEPSFRTRPGSIVPRQLLEPPLNTRAELDLLREDLRRIGLYTGTLVSLDGKFTAILIGAPRNCDRTQLYEQVRTVIAAPRPAGDEISVTGAPVAESLLGIHILEDLGVPAKLLGTSTRSSADTTRGEPANSFRALRLFIARRIGLVPVAIVVMALVFFVTFRNPLATLVPLPGVLATLLFVFGLMGWAGVPVYLTTAVMPVLLVATGVTNDIYLFTRYFSLLREKPGVRHVELLDETFGQLACAVAITSLTTGVGFFSFALSPLGPVRAFGLWTGAGVLFGLFYSLTAVPAMLALIPPAWLLPRRRPDGRSTVSALAAAFSGLERKVTRWKWHVLALACAATALAPLGLRRLVVQDSWTDAFDPDSEFHHSTQAVNDHFYGMHLLLVCLDASKLQTGDLSAPPDVSGQIVLPGTICKELAELEGSAITLSAAGSDGTTRVWRTQLQLPRRAGASIIAWLLPAPDSARFAPGTVVGKIHYELAMRAQLKPEIVEANRELAAFLRARSDCAVGGVIGPYEYLATTRFMSRPDDPAARTLMPLASENRTLWNYYAFALGENRLREVMDTNYWRSLTTVFLKDANFVDTARLMSEIRAYESERLAPKGIKLGFAGDVAVSQSLIQGIVTTQLRSLFWSLAGIFVVTTLLGGSLRWGIYCLLPSALAVLVKLAVMGWLGIPLGVATSMFAAMTLGLGVNCAVQLLEGCERARAAGTPEREIVNRALTLSGPPALINTLAVSLGFGVLMLSQVPANARLGLLVVIGLLGCLIASLLLLPLLLHWWPPKQQPKRTVEN